jgi:hypothetical protein
MGFKEVSDGAKWVVRDLVWRSISRRSQTNKKANFGNGLREREGGKGCQSD